MYVAVWLFYYLFVPDLIDVYTSYVLNNCTEADLQARTAGMANCKEMYKTPLFVGLITCPEVLPIGLVVALVSAFLFSQKKTTNFENQ